MDPSRSWGKALDQTDFSAFELFIDITGCDLEVSPLVSKLTLYKLVTFVFRALPRVAHGRAFIFKVCLSDLGLKTASAFPGVFIRKLMATPWLHAVIPTGSVLRRPIKSVQSPEFKCLIFDVFGVE